MGKLALKKLTASDLTFFEWHFRNRNAGNQKAINLNRDVFIDRLYPSLPSIAHQSEGKLPLDLTIYGPGLKGEYNLQRKIVKFGTYKNWRLDGEFIYNPEQDPDRFNVLIPGDFVIFDFSGETHPISVKAVLIAKNIGEDTSLHTAFTGLIREDSMIELTSKILEEVISTASPPDQHPIYELTLASALEDASLGGVTGIEKLLKRRSGRKISHADLERARQNASYVGEIGESFVNFYLEGLQKEGKISDVEWISVENAIAPYDFKFKESGGTQVMLDAKSTTGEFDRQFHISMSELELMTGEGGRYDLYRVFEVGEYNAKLRVANDMKAFAKSTLAVIRRLPSGVIPDSLSIAPSILNFGPTIKLRLPEEKEESSS